MWAFFLKALASFGYNLMVALVGEAMIQWAFFKAARWVTSKTPTKVDDEFIEKLEGNYQKHSGPN